MKVLQKAIGTESWTAGIFFFFLNQPLSGPAAITNRATSSWPGWESALSPIPEKRLLGNTPRNRAPKPGMERAPLCSLIQQGHTNLHPPFSAQTNQGCTGSGDFQESWHFSLPVLFSSCSPAVMSQLGQAVQKSFPTEHCQMCPLWAWLLTICILSIIPTQPLAAKVEQPKAGKKKKIGLFYLFF